MTRNKVGEGIQGKGQKREDRVSRKSWSCSHLVTRSPFILVNDNQPNDDDDESRGKMIKCERKRFVPMMFMTICSPNQQKGARVSGTWWGRLLLLISMPHMMIVLFAEWESTGDQQKRYDHHDEFRSFCQPADFYEAFAPLSGYYESLRSIRSLFW